MGLIWKRCDVVGVGVDKLADIWRKNRLIIGKRREEIMFDFKVIAEACQ